LLGGIGWGKNVDLDLTFLALAIPAILFAGISKGGFGSGAAFAATPFLALALDPAVAVGFMLPLLMVMDATGLRVYWGKWDRQNAKALMIGGAPGVILAALLFPFLNADALRLMIGLIALGFVLFQVLRGAGVIFIPQKPFRAPVAWGWGALAGFTSFISHAGGPPAAVHLLSQRLSKTAYQATTVIAFFWINIVKLPAFFATGLISWDMLGLNLLFVPVAVLGTVLGVYAHHLVPSKLFFNITYVLLAVTGTKLIFDALT